MAGHRAGVVGLGICMAMEVSEVEVEVEVVLLLLLLEGRICCHLARDAGLPWHLLQRARA